MTDRELMQQALDALECYNDEWLADGSQVSVDLTIKELRARLAQPEQEPVCWLWETESGQQWFAFRGMEIPEGAEPLYTAPPQREWQGLTDEELLSVMQGAKDFQGRIAMTWVNHENQTYVTDVGNRIARAIEAKLKEKNA